MLFQFSETASWVGCFSTLVQGNQRNKQVSPTIIMSFRVKHLRPVQMNPQEQTNSGHSARDWLVLDDDFIGRNNAVPFLSSIWLFDKC